MPTSYNNQRADGWQSIWIGRHRNEVDLDRYLSGAFKSEFGFDWPWQRGPEFDVAVEPIPIRLLLSSFPNLPVDEIEAFATGNGWAVASSVVLFDRLKYNCSPAGTMRGMFFLGVFPQKALQRPVERETQETETANLDFQDARAEPGTNSRRPHGTTDLMEAARAHDLMRVLALLTAGSDVALRDDRGHTALHYSVRMQVVSSAHAAEQAACVRMLVDADGSDVDPRSDTNETPLMIAARTGLQASAKALVEAGAGLAAINDAGQTAEQLARSSGHQGLADYLASNAEA